MSSLLFVWLLWLLLFVFLFYWWYFSEGGRAGGGGGGEGGGKGERIVELNSIFFCVCVCVNFSVHSYSYRLCYASHFISIFWVSFPGTFGVLNFYAMSITFASVVFFFLLFFFFKL